MDKKPGFVLYHEDYKAIKSILSADDIVKLLDMLVEYSETGECAKTENNVINAFMLMMKQKIDNGNTKYNELSEKRRRAGIKSGETRREQAISSNEQTSEQSEQTNTCSSAANNEQVFEQNEQNEQNEQTNKCSLAVNNELYKIKQNKIKQDNIKKNNIVICPSADADAGVGKVYSDDFEKFWKAYPKKVGKGGAYRAYKNIKAVKTLLPDMLDSLEKHKNSEQWKRNNGQFIPNPQTWLNQRRWEDEVIIRDEHKPFTADELRWS